MPSKQTEKETGTPEMELIHGTEKKVERPSCENLAKTKEEADRFCGDIWKSGT